MSRTGHARQLLVGLTMALVMALTLISPARADAASASKASHRLLINSAKPGLALGQFLYDDNWYHNDRGAVLLIGAGGRLQRTSTPAEAFAWCNHKNRFGRFDRTHACLALAQSELSHLRDRVEYFLGGPRFVNSCDSYARRRLLQDRAGAWTVRFLRAVRPLRVVM